MAAFVISIIPLPEPLWNNAPPYIGLILRTMFSKRRFSDVFNSFTLKMSPISLLSKIIFCFVIEAALHSRQWNDVRALFRTEIQHVMILSKHQLYKV